MPTDRSKCLKPSNQQEKVLYTKPYPIIVGIFGHNKSREHYVENSKNK